MRERGQSAAEFALVLPVLAVVVLGMLDFGRILAQYQAGANAAREAAQYCGRYPYPQRVSPGVYETIAQAQARFRARVITSGGSPDQAELGGRYPDSTAVVWVTAAGGTPSGGGVDYCPAATTGQDIHARVTIRFDAITPVVGQWLVTNAATDARSVFTASPYPVP